MKTASLFLCLVLFLCDVPSTLADPASGLLVHLKMDETNGLSAHDSTTNSYHGTLMNFPENGVPWSVGRIGGGLHFEGNGRVILDDQRNLLNFARATNSSFSLVLWVNGADYQPDGVGFISRGYGRGEEQYLLDLYKGLLRFIVRDASGASFGVKTNLTLNNTWRHLAATYDSADAVKGIKLYVNGVKVDEAPGPLTLLDNSHEVSVGSREESKSSGYNLSLNGTMDDVRFYGRALSGSEIAALYRPAAPARTASPPSSKYQFFTDFNAGLPPATHVYGTAVIDATEGVDGKGGLRLTEAEPGQLGSFVVDAFGEKQPLIGFSASFKAFIGGGRGADGFAFCSAPELPHAAFGESGAGQGLTVTFDTFKIHDDVAPGIQIYTNKTLIFAMPFAGLRAERFVDVAIHVSPDGRLKVTYDDVRAVTNLWVGLTNIGSCFSLSARTGDHTDRHAMDDLLITIQPPAPAFIESFLPIGAEVLADSAIEVTLAETEARAVKLTLDNVTVVPITATNADHKVTLQYQPTYPFEPGSSHTVGITYRDRDGKSRPTTNTFSYSFMVTPESTQ